MGRILSARQATLWTAGVVLLAAGLAPLCVMVAASFSAGGSFSTAHYVDALGNRRIWTLFGNSLLLAVLTTALAGIGGVSLGLLLAKTDLPLRKFLLAFFSLPLLFPPYLLAAGWFEVLQRGGL